MFKSNQANDKKIVKSLFKFNIPLELSNQEIDKAKFLVLGGNSNEDMETICKKISNDDLIVNVRTLDIFYEYE